MKSNIPCSNCHYENPSGSIYCQHCGEKLKEKKAKSSFRDLIPISGLGQTGQKGASPSLAPLAGFAMRSRQRNWGNHTGIPNTPVSRSFRWMTERGTVRSAGKRTPAVSVKAADLNQIKG